MTKINLYRFEGCFQIFRIVTKIGVIYVIILSRKVKI